MNEPEMRRRRRLNKPVQIGAWRYGAVKLERPDDDGSVDTETPAPDNT